MKSYSIIYEDDLILLVNKKQGIPTVPGTIKGSLIEEVFTDFPYLRNVKGYKEFEGGLLNRLDNETGGIVFIAKNDHGFEYYSSQMKQGRIIKIYYAVVEGYSNVKSNIIKFPIVHHPKYSNRMIIYEKNKKYSGKIQYGETEYRVINSNNSWSLLEVRIRKGIRHQIRIHLAKVGLPIVGDKIYNTKIYEGIDNHLLFAKKVIFLNEKGEEITVEADIPECFYL